MVKMVNNVFENVPVKLDNIEFVDCRFINCTMEYSGTGPVSISGCHFTNARWIFSGPAQNTLQFLRAVYHGMGEGGKKIIEQTFDNIRKPPEST